MTNALFSNLIDGVTCVFQVFNIQWYVLLFMSDCYCFNKGSSFQNVFLTHLISDSGKVWEKTCIDINLRRIRNRPLMTSQNVFSWKCSLIYVYVWVHLSVYACVCARVMWVYVWSVKKNYLRIWITFQDLKTKILMFLGQNN